MPTPSLGQGRHFCDLETIDGGSLRHILDVAGRWKNGEAHADRCAGRILAMIFAQPSTRTRLSFTLSMRALGGDVVTLERDGSQLGRGETFADTARLLSRYSDIVALRARRDGDLRDMMDHISVPLINALTDRSHPCQVMADVMTFEEARGSIKGQSIAWIGDGNNMAYSWAQAAVHFDFTLRMAMPPSCALPARDIARLEALGARLQLCETAAEAATGAACIVTDTWVSMGMEEESAEAEEKTRALRDYQVNADIMAMGNNAIFMHCLPAHRGCEVSADVFDGDASWVWHEAENRIHVQKAILAWCLGAV